MRSNSRLSLRTWDFLQREAAVGLAAMVFTVAGCGGLTGGGASTDAHAEQEAKVQALLKQGKSLSEIRAIMKGEPEPKKQTKGKQTKARGKR